VDLTATSGSAQRQRIADYTFVRFLGEGNYGAYYLAVAPPRLPTEAEHVAVKVLTGATGEDALRRMAKELGVFASVQSRHLVTLLDAGQEGSTCYYAMQFYPDGSLAAPAASLSRADVRRAVAEAALGAHALHEAGIVHRDIKPGNVLLAPDGAKLSDLGLAQVLSPGQTMTGMGPIGSVEYMDPDIIRGGRASRASDVWALGVTLHRAVSGRSVYGELPERDSLLALRHVLKTTPRLDPSLSEGEAQVVAACLDPDPARRPATAEAVADRLAAL
jgi:serine/threonine protein kinase